MPANTMSTEHTLSELVANLIVAVIRAPDRTSAVRSVEALVAGGVRDIEITYSTPEAAEVMAELDRRYGGDIVLGAGTIRQPAQAREAAEAGARFLVSPGTTASLASSMVQTGTLLLFGALTPSDIMNATELGASVIKIFPASLGGPAYLRSLRGPFPDVPFCPTGGVNPTTIPEWLDAGALLLGAGSELCSVSDLAAGRWNTVTDNARTFIKAAGR